MKNRNQDHKDEWKTPQTLKEIVSSLTKDTGSKKAVEKLFRYKTC